MSLREHLVLKYISIILFCLGLLAPTIACTFQPKSNKETTSRTILSITHAASLNSLFEEKEIEEERDGKNNSVLYILFSYHPFNHFTLGQQQVNYFIAQHHQKYQTQPLLFKKHCLYLI